MANGDLTFKTLYSAALGGGRDANGNPKQGKRFVVGEINGEYLLAGMKVHPHGGPQAFGVNSLDYLFLEVISSGDGAVPDAEKLPHADYDHANQLIFVTEDCGASQPAVPTNADAIVIRFVAIGDDPTTPALG